MSSIFHYILLGIIQGLTEFIPVSSSAHLVFAQYFFGIKEPQILFDIVLHLGTLFAVIIYFRKDIIDILKSVWCPHTIGFKMLLLLAVGTIPVAIGGFFLKDYFKLLFLSPVFSSVFLLITGIILFFTKFKKSNKKNIDSFSFFDSFFIGIAQVIAIAPGISRSGITISCGLFRGIDRKLCAKYSLLLSIPAILGAVLSEIKEIKTIGAEKLICISIGFITSFLVGYLAISFLIRCIEKAKFYIFSYYCWIVGIISLIYFLNI